MKKILVISILFFTLNFVPPAFAMEVEEEKESASTMQIDSEKSSGVKRKLEDINLEKKENKESKKRKIEEKNSPESNQASSAMEIDSENSSAAVTSYSPNLDSNQEEEGFSRLPAEILLIIFEVDFYKLSNQQGLRKVISPFLFFYTDNYDARCQLKECIDHLLKFFAINQNCRAIISEKQNYYIKALIKSFEPIFFTIVKFPVRFEEFLKKEAANLKVRGLTRNERCLQFPNEWQQLCDAGKKNELPKSDREDRRLAPCLGTGYFGVICRLENSRKEDLINVVVSRSSDFFEIDPNAFLEILEKNIFSINGTCLNLLMIAAFVANEELVEYLLECKSDVNAVCQPHKMYKKINCELEELPKYRNVNALSLAKTRKVMEILMKAGAKDLTCLKIFIKYADLETIKYYLEDVIWQKLEKTQIWEEAFLQSIKSQRIILFDYFINHICKEIRNETLDRAIFTAVKHKQIELLKVLVEVKQKNKYLEIAVDDPYKDSKENTALKIACKNGDLQIIQILFECGDEYLGECEEYGIELLLACIEGEKRKDLLEKIPKEQFENIVRLLVRNGALINLGRMGNEPSPIEETNNPRIKTILFIEMMREFNLNHEQIIKIIEEEKNNNP